MTAKTQTEINTAVLMFLPANDYISADSTTMLSYYSSMWMNFYNDSTGSSDSLIIYNTLVGCVRYIILQVSTLNVSGQWSEKEGPVSRSGMDTNYTSGWQDLLDYLLAHPDIIDVAIGFPSSSDTATTPIVIGGVSRSDYEAVANNSDSMNGGYTIGESFKGMNPNVEYLFDYYTRFRKWNG